MTNSILQSFLDNQFIKTDQLDHIEKLGKVSLELKKKLGKKKQKIVDYTLVALDPVISDVDPVVVEVEGLIIKKWPTFRNSVGKTKDKPVTYIRAVILDALNMLSKDNKAAAIIWYTGCNIVSYYKLAGQEEVLTEFILEIGKKVEVSSRKNWSVLECSEVSAPEEAAVTLPEINNCTLNEVALKNHLLAAAVHQGWSEQAGGGENPHTQVTNNYNWPQFFAERAAEGLTKSINSTLSSQNKSIKSISDFVGKYLANVRVEISSVALQSVQSLNKRSDLLWWKQSLYSSKLDCSYRELAPLALASAMADDLSCNVSPACPRSVDFFLKETLRDVMGGEIDKEASLIEWIKQIQELSDAEKELLGSIHNEYSGRKSLGSCIASIMNKQIKEEDLFKHTGMEKNAQISLASLTVWLFHDLQANILACEK